MPAFGSPYTDSEIAAVANYVAGRFGSVASQLTAQDVAELRTQTARQAIVGELAPRSRKYPRGRHNFAKVTLRLRAYVCRQGFRGPLPFPLAGRRRVQPTHLKETCDGRHVR